jgi:stage II sporulation protein Q
MNEQDKTKQHSDETPKLNRGGSTAVKASAWKRLMSKKWVSPALFMAAAAIIVTFMWFYQGTDQKETAATNTGLTEASGGSGQTADEKTPETVPVTAGQETLQWPVLNRSELEIAVPYYDAAASNEEKEAAMVQTGTTFIPHMGVDLASADNKAFDVVAAMSGKVTLVEIHPTNGNVVEITHPNGLRTIYQSLGDVQVNNGDEVKQGTIIAKAGRNELEKDEGVHLHFEVRDNEKPVNPNLFLEEVKK